MNEKRMANCKELLEMRKEVVSEEEYRTIREQYKMTEAQRKMYETAEVDINMTEKRYCLITKRAVKLAKVVISNGGSKDEVKRAIVNLMICMDAMKYDLDWGKWKRDNDIALLIRKYMVKIKKV